MNLRLPLANTPLPFPPGATACAAYRGQDVCCSDATLDGIVKAYNVTRTSLDEMRRAMAAVKLGDVITQIVTGICSALPCPPSVQQTAAKYKTRINDAFSAVLSADVRCGACGARTGPRPRALTAARRVPRRPTASRA